MEKKLRGYIENEVVRDLSDCIEFHSRTDDRTNEVVNFARVTSPLGIRRLSKLDFLVNHCEYRVMFDFMGK